MKLFLSLALLYSMPVFAQQTMNDPYLLIGTYTSGESDGIYVYKFHSSTGQLTRVSSIKTSNPSYLAVSSKQDMIYAVNENADSTRFTSGGSVASFSFNKSTGTLTAINKQSSGGKHPCYVSIDQTGKWLTAGNYSSGTVGVLRINKDGSLQEPNQVVEHFGQSVDESRQQGPHVHATVFSPDNKYLFVPDLGIDKVMIYSFNARSGKLAPAKPAFHHVEPGHGPRHITFAPGGNFAYLVEEMSGSISAYSYSKGKMELIQQISALPGDFNGSIGSADIHVSPDGKFLYASNRGSSNTIGIFSINTNGMLTSVGHQSTLGKTPRNFVIDPSGNFLLVANQGTNDIVVFKRDVTTGLLSETGNRIEVSKPVCLKWISAE